MAYTVLLVLFLMATLGYTYIYSRNVILEESENSLTDTAQMLNGNLEMEEMELLHYTEIVKDDLRIKEYVFMVSVVGTDDEALHTLYDRQFGWLPVERRIIMTNHTLVAAGQTALWCFDRQYLRAHRIPDLTRVCHGGKPIWETG